MAAIGILGGTFDPVHNAHLAWARAALEHLQLERVLFIPTGTTRYRNPAVASGDDRAAMLRLALAGEPRFRLDTRELRPEASGWSSLVSSRKRGSSASARRNIAARSSPEATAGLR